MKKALLGLALIISLAAAFAAGNYKGYGDAYSAWELKVEETRQMLTEGTYHMAWTNTRACVLALDSEVMRFLSAPTPAGLKEVRARQGACQQHWDLLFKYSPDDPEEYRNIDEARFMFDNWQMQIEHILELQVTMLTALNAGREGQAVHIFEALREERVESAKFRDHIERELFEAW
jgi:hypothetical protein